MKILNLLEAPYQTSVVGKETNRPIEKVRPRAPDSNAEGSFAIVKPDRTDPHMVKKYNRRAAQSNDNRADGFRDFITFIVKNNYTDNIFMPRVYEVKKVKGNDGYSIDSFKVEKLIHASAIDTEQLIGYILTVANEELMSHYNPGWRNKPHDTFTAMVTREIESTGNVFSSNELNQACLIIRRAIATTKRLNDLHEDNIMYRRTSVGIQAVFNDPLY